MWEIWVQSLGQEDTLEKGMATHSSILARKSHGRRSLVGYNPEGGKKLDTIERLHIHISDITGASLVAQIVKNLPVMQKTQDGSLGQEDTLEKGMATHSRILAWRIPWAEEPGRVGAVG